MQSDAKTVDEYIESLPEDRKEAISTLRKSILDNIQEGFKGYHSNPKLPLPFINLASQKNYIALYHMGIYVNPDLLKWFTDEYSKITMLKLDMGKGCIRFKKPDKIPFALIGELVSRISVKDWISFYEKTWRERIKN